jgi:hypothetical protein
MSDRNSQENRSTAYQRIPGQGFVFFRTNQPDARTKSEQKALAEKKPVPRVSVWRGWLALPGGVEVQVRAIGSTRTKSYAYTLHRFPQNTPVDNDEPQGSAWEKLAEFKLPAFGDMPYVEGEFKLGDHTYKIRAIKTDEGFIRLRLPQVMNTRAAHDAMV